DELDCEIWRERPQLVGHAVRLPQREPAPAGSNAQNCHIQVHSPLAPLAGRGDGGGGVPTAFCLLLTAYSPSPHRLRPIELPFLNVREHDERVESGQSGIIYVLVNRYVAVQLPQRYERHFVIND